MSKAIKELGVQINQYYAELENEEGESIHERWTERNIRDLPSRNQGIQNSKVGTFYDHPGKGGSGMSQLSFDDLMLKEFHEKEKKLPWFLQVSSAALLKFTGEDASHPGPDFHKHYPTNLEKGSTGFITGSGPGLFNTGFNTGRKSCLVKYMDLVPLKVTEFTKEEKEMKWPEDFTVVEVVSNNTMEVIDEGWLTALLPDRCFIKDRLPSGEFLKVGRWHDLRTHHFKGFEPKRMLVWKDEAAGK